MVQEQQVKQLNYRRQKVFEDPDAMQAKKGSSQCAISNTHLRMLIDEIIIYDEDGTLRIKIVLNEYFYTHFDLYDCDGNTIDTIGEPTKHTKFKELTFAQVLECYHYPKKISVE